MEVIHMMMVYPSKQRYDKRTLVRVAVAFNRNTDKELTEFIENKENRPEYIRSLVRADMDKQSANK
jgi:hypothetical protein